MKIILASSSPRRKDILERNNYKFDIIPSNFDEVMNSALCPVSNVINMAKGKALDVVNKGYYDDIVIGCDTVVVLDDTIYGKPKDSADASRMLNELQGKTHKVISGVAIYYKENKHEFAVTSLVTFKKLCQDDINEYISSKEPFGKAGSYAIQGIGRKLIDHYEGELDNIIGLPIEEIKPIIDSYLNKNEVEN